MTSVQDILSDSEAFVASPVSIHGWFLMRYDNGRYLMELRDHYDKDASLPVADDPDLCEKVAGSLFACGGSVYTHVFQCDVEGMVRKGNDGVVLDDVTQLVGRIEGAHEEVLR